MQFKYLNQKQCNLIEKNIFILCVYAVYTHSNKKKLIKRVVKTLPQGFKEMFNHHFKINKNQVSKQNWFYKIEKIDQLIFFKI